MTEEHRILTTHVGSLARPKKLLDYIGAMTSDVAVDNAAFAACLTASVAEVVTRQAEAGVDIVSDGEFGKFRGWAAYSLSRLGGFDEGDFEVSTSAMPRYRNEYYKSEEEFFFALADALHEEYAAIIDAGLFLQVDDAFLPYMYAVSYTHLT